MVVFSGFGLIGTLLHTRRTAREFKLRSEQPKTCRFCGKPPRSRLELELCEDHHQSFNRSQQSDPDISYEQWAHRQRDARASDT